MTTALPANASQTQPTDVNQLRCAVRARDNSGFVFMHNFQDHVATHDLDNLQIALQTKSGELKIPSDSTFTLKNETATFFPFNFDFDGVRAKYATAQPFARLTEKNGVRYAFVAVDGIRPEFALESVPAAQIQSADCEITSEQSTTMVRCPTDKISEFTVKNDAGQSITFVLFPKQLALHAWRLQTPSGEHLLFSDSTVLQQSGGAELSNIGNNIFSFSVYPAIAEAPKSQAAALAEIPAPHPSMSAYTLTLPSAEPFVHAKVADRKTLTLSSDQSSLPEHINDVFLDIDYTGDVGLAFIDGQLVDDHFYFGQPWRIGLKRFLPRLAEDGMYISFRPMRKDAPFLPDLPAAAVPDFSAASEVLHINQVRVLPEYKMTLSF